MKEELKFEFLILLCICSVGFLVEKILTATSLSPLLLYGGIFGIASLLLVCALFTTMSVSSVSDHSEARKNTRVLYGFLSMIAILALLLLLLFEAESIIFWSVICILWYLTCTIRIALFWKWF